MTQRILVLDDEENYVEMLKLLLEQNYFLVDSETDPQKALKLLEEIGYDLIISDYKMPVMDGADFLRKAREIGPDLPFIIISGLMNTPELVKVANIGVTLVLEKPIDIENFLAHVKRFVKPLSQEAFEKHSSAKSQSESHSLQSDGRQFVKAYPETLKYLSDASPSQQFFLQDVWDALQEQDHVFIQTPPGAEVELMLREFSQWTGDAPSRTALVDMAAPPVDYSKLFAHLKSKEGTANCLIGFANYAAASMEMQDLLVAALHGMPENFSCIHFIDASLLDGEQPRINQELLDLIHLSLCRMPPLQERLADMATYTQRFLPKIAAVERRPEKALADAGARALLLRHSWPANFAELIHVLRAAVLLGGEGPLNVDDLLKAFQRLGSQIDTDSTPPSLEQVLCMRQCQLLKQAMEENQKSLKDLWPTLHTELEEQMAENTPETLPLLYPELLETK